MDCRRATGRTQAEASHEVEHDGDEERDADEIIEMAVKEARTCPGLDDPAIDEIEDQTGQKEGIAEIAEGHGEYTAKDGTSKIKSSGHWAEWHEAAT